MKAQRQYIQFTATNGVIQTRSLKDYYGNVDYYEAQKGFVIFTSEHHPNLFS